jgi:hypothetical protein
MILGGLVFACRSCVKLRKLTQNDLVDYAKMCSAPGIFPIQFVFTGIDVVRWQQEAKGSIQYV